MARVRRGRMVVNLLALLVALFAVIVALRYGEEIGAARERVAGGSRLLQTPCGPIEYALIGDGPPLLVVHGAGGGYDQGLELGRSLAERGFQVVAMSRFGYLRTPLPEDGSAVAQADAHACLLDALGIDRAAIIGVSAGAPSTMQFALRHPRRCAAMVLLVPAAYVPRPGGAPPLKAPAATQFLFDTALRSDFLFWSIIRFARPVAIRAILATPVEVVERASPGEQARVDSVLRKILPVNPRRLGLLNDAAIASSLPRYDLERIETPSLVISVADDLFGTFDAARYTAAHLPEARFVGYPTGGHLWVGHHEEVVDEMANFLRAAPAR